ncbi:MAG TPA: hypothetical protein VFL85_02930 [Candidatus Saccharimonadales bacterium]|nr:hypothetical protein [Candidatus Saccharimonadales bacterium]
MEHAQEILVIIVSATLALFLLVAIVVLVLIARLVVIAKRAINKAEHVIDSAEAATTVIKNAGGPLAALKIIRTLLQYSKKFRK